MKVTGLITEYNPFHSGHQYHMDEARRLTGADAILVVMSGDFVQRGLPAITDKYSRTRMALTAGADAVIELPLAAATGSAGILCLRRRTNIKCLRLRDRSRIWLRVRSAGVADSDRPLVV